jgi:hypothetical protein
MRRWRENAPEQLSPSGDADVQSQAGYPAHVAVFERKTHVIRCLEPTSSPTRGPVSQVSPPTRVGCCACANADAVKASVSKQAPTKRWDFDISLSDRLVTAIFGSLHGVRHRSVVSSAAVVVWNGMRPPAAGAIPAPAVPPIVTVPMPMVPMGAGDGSGSRSYRRTASAA